MNTRKILLSLFAALASLVSSALAQTTITEATIQRVSGSASVTRPGGSTVALMQGMKVPQGSIITTGADGDVYLESHAGYVTSIKPNSVVGVTDLSVTTEGGVVKEEKTVLDLKSGAVVAVLDPNKKAVNNYQVHTEKGVTTANGTVFTVRYNGGDYTVAVVNGKVTITPPAGVLAGFNTRERTATTLEAGSVRHARANGTTSTSNLDTLNTSTASEADNSMRTLLAMAVATVAVAAQNNIGGTTAAEAASVAQAILTAVPSVAEQAGAMMNASGVGSTVVAAIQAVTPASAVAALNSGVTTGTFTPNVTTTAANPGGTPVVTPPTPLDVSVKSGST